MSSVVDSVGSLFGRESAGERASRHGMERQLEYQNEGLQYLQDTDAIPRQLRETALTRLGGLYGAGEKYEAPNISQLIGDISYRDKHQGGTDINTNLENVLTGLMDGSRDRNVDVDSLIEEIAGPTAYRKFTRDLKNSGSLRSLLEDAMGGEYDDKTQDPGVIQQEILDQARNNPLYASLQKEGEEGIMRNASMTGGLRSGNVQENLYDYNARLLGNLYNQEVQGLRGFTNPALSTGAIANQYNSMGDTMGMGTVAQAQSQAASQQQGMEVLQYGIFGKPSI